MEIVFYHNPDDWGQSFALAPIVPFVLRREKHDNDFLGFDTLSDAQSALVNFPDGEVFGFLNRKWVKRAVSPKLN